MPGVAGLHGLAVQAYRELQGAARLDLVAGELRDRGYDVGDRVPVAGPTGRTELPIIGIFKLTSSLNVGGLGYAAMEAGDDTVAELFGEQLMLWSERSRDPATGLVHAGADPRRECYALAW